MGGSILLSTSDVFITPSKPSIRAVVMAAMPNLTYYFLRLVSQHHLLLFSARPFTEAAVLDQAFCLNNLVQDPCFEPWYEFVRFSVPYKVLKQQ
jgi:hypothetical protein